jgi:hypothetical protein
MKKRFFLAFIGLVFSFSFIKAQSSADTYAKTIKAKRLKEHVYILASDSCAGRNIGTSGIEIARNYIINQWKKTPILEPYFIKTWLQPFPLVTYGNTITHLQAGNSVLSNYKDYMYKGKYDGFEKELPIVFAGYGRDLDFEKLDVEGKAVFILNENLLNALINARTAHEYGAELTIVANPTTRNQFESISSQREEFYKFKDYKSPNDTLLQSFILKLPKHTRYITINSKTVKKLTNRSILQWKDTSIDEYDSIGTVKISVEQVTADTIFEKNIVAFIPGINNKESIVIGAHYDHLGVVDNEIYYGADDNASGTAALLELVRAFSNAYEQGFRPKRNIIFVAFSAEEGGLCGSEYYVDQIENAEDIKLMINIDMIGRASQKHINESNHFYFVGKNLIDSIYRQNDMLCKKHRLTPDYTSNSNASDQKPFADIGIPTIFYFDGINYDYHKPSDTPNKIDYKRMERITKMIFETIWINADVEKE